MADRRDILVRLLGEETVSKMAGRAEKGLDKFGDSLDATEKDAKDLDRQIAEVEADLKTLAVAFARTSDAADRMDISKAMRKQQAELRKLTKSKDFLPDFGKAGEDAARGFGASFVARLGPLMASAPLGPAGAAAGVALGAAAAPSIAAAVSGAVVGAAGVGGVIGGVVLAARDPRVKAAGSALGGFILGDLERRSSGFVPEVLDGIADIRAGWQAMGPDLDRVFESSRFVDPLVQGAISGGKKFVAGFADAIDKGDPAVDAFGRLFDQMGESIGGALSSMAEDADEGAAAIDDLTMAVSRFVDSTAAIVHAGSVVRGWTGEVDKAIDRGRFWLEDWVSSGGAMEHFGWQLDLTADGFKAGSKEALAYRQAALGTAEAADFATLKTAGMTDAEIAAADASGTYRQQLDEAADALGRTGQEAGTATTQVQSFTDALRELRDQNLSVIETEIEFERALDETAAAAEKAKGGLDKGTEAGRKNWGVLTALVRDTKEYSAAVFERTGSEDAAAAVTEEGRKAFIKAAVQMGMSEKAAKDYANQLFGIPSDVDTNADFHPDNQGVKRWKKTLSGIPRHIFIKAEFDLINNSDVAMALRLGRLSKGGPVKGAGPKGVDSQPYLLAPGEHVLTADEVDAAGGHSGVEKLRAALRGQGGVAVPSAAGAMRSGGGGGTQRVEVVLRIEGNDRGIVGALLKGIKDMGGNPAVLGIGGNW